MFASFRNLQSSTGRLQLRPQAPARLPRVEALEDRCLLQGGPLTSDGFVTQLYRDVLNREPDQGGLSAWTAMLNSGQGQDSKAQQAMRAEVAQAFLNSVEYRMDVVQGFYDALLHRAADPAGLNTWTNFLAQGGTQLQLEAKLLGSDEYFTTRGGGTINGYLQALYQDVLNRQIDPVGLQAATASLSPNDTAASRTDVASGVINSQEGDIATIDHLYSQFLHRAPDSTGLNAFLAGFQENQNASNPANRPENQNAGTPPSNVEPPQASIIPAQLQNSGSNSGSNSGQPAGITLEQAMVDILSSPEYFAQADR